MYVHRPHTLPSDAVKVLDVGYMRLDTYLAREGNESTCVIKRKNETEDLEK